MSEIIAVPTVEQINLEHQLAQSKAAEAVQHAVNCGLMLLQVKATKVHGEWLPWLQGEIESGRLSVKDRQARKYMQLASNMHHGANLIEAPSIRAALELLADKDPESQAELPGLEAERQAREDAEAAAVEYQQTAEFFKQQAYASAAKEAELKRRVAELEAHQAEPDPKLLQDLEATKRESTRIEKEKQALEAAKAKLEKEQDKLVASQVKAKLRERHDELATIDRQVKALSEQAEKKKAYLDSLDSELKRAETHESVIHSVNCEIINAGVFLADEDPIDHALVRKKWATLAKNLTDLAGVIHLYLNGPGSTPGEEPTWTTTLPPAVIPN